MHLDALSILIVVLAVVFVWILFFKRGSCMRRDSFASENQTYAIAAMEDLNTSIQEGTVVDVGDKLLEHFEAEDVIMVAKPGPAEMAEGHLFPKETADHSAPKETGDHIEHLTFLQPIDTRYWPYYYYSYPYRYMEGGAWPPDMYSRLRNWEPGFQTSGWSYWMRPGITYTKMPRNRWIRSNGSYYYINNGTDRMFDFYHSGW